MNSSISQFHVEQSALLTDLYHLTMAQAYYAENMNDIAVFELFFRSLPDSRNYLVACGIDGVLGYLENFKFPNEAVDYLGSLAQFSSSFLNWLAKLEFSGDVYAVPEGTIVFADEPVIQIVAPLIEAQIIESFLMNHIHYQTLVASKASRIATVAAGRSVVDFGMRRTHGVGAAMMAARAGYISGLDATSNVLAGKEYGIPLAGTMAHSYIQTHDDESKAFRDFVRLYPQTTLLVDTYDTLEGVKKVVELSNELGDDFAVSAVRIDAGDVVNLSEQVREILDQAGLEDVRIVASGNMDEYAIARLSAAGAPVDGFGVGTRVGVSQDAPFLDSAYKLVEYRGEGRLKFAQQKASLPWRKQVFRESENGVFSRDVIGRFDEKLPGEPLLNKVMEKGTRLPCGDCDMETARAHVGAQLRRLPAQLRRLDRATKPYLVEKSELISKDRDRLAARFSWVPGVPQI